MGREGFEPSTLGIDGDPSRNRRDRRLRGLGGRGAAGAHARLAVTSGIDRRAHWDRVFEERGPSAVRWNERSPRMSLEMIDLAGIGPHEGVVDVGGGASPLAGALLARGFDDVTVLDLSEVALLAAHAARSGGRQGRLDPRCRSRLDPRPDPRAVARPRGLPFSWSRSNPETATSPPQDRRCASAGTRWWAPSPRTGPRPAPASGRPVRRPGPRRRPRAGVHHRRLPPRRAPHTGRNGPGVHLGDIAAMGLVRSAP